MSMENNKCLALIFFLLISTVQINASRSHNLHKKPVEKLTKFQVYVHDILTPPTPTILPVASANSTATSPTSFGLISVMDDPIRLEPNLSAPIIGRAQGLLTFSSLEETSIHMSYDLVFTDGEFNGSTLCLIGHNPYLTAYRELAVIGGSGVFRFARGFLQQRTVNSDFFQYNVTVLHY